MNEAYWLVTFRVFVGGIAVGLDLSNHFTVALHYGMYGCRDLGHQQSVSVG